jgi:cell division protein ZapA (FtsZ GTPase activity inhibitor)
MNRLELRKLSLEFRRLSSNLLNSTNDTADINISRFLKFIDGNELISEIIQDKISGVDYDFKECYDIGSADWADYTPPVDEACHIKAQYDYLNFINNENTVNVRSQAMNYCWSDNNINTVIQNFLEIAFKLLIDFINDQLSIEMIVLDEEAKTMGGNTYIQNIKTVNGSASQQNSGVITTYNTTNDTSSMLELIDKLLASLPEIQGVNTEEIENVKDDLEMVQEQLKTDNPKKSRIGKALAGIKKFVSDFSMKLAVTLAAGAVTGADWGVLLRKLENFIR